MAKLQLIGTGSFSKVYKKDSKTVLVISEDPCKECLALFPVNSRLFPTVNRVDCNNYEMKYYPKVKSLKSALKPSQYELYKELRAIFNKFVPMVKQDIFYWIEQFNTISNKSAKKALIEMGYNMANYNTNIRFEISPRNVAVSPSGNLVLLDVFFDRDLLESKRNY